MSPNFLGVRGDMLRSRHFLLAPIKWLYFFAGSIFCAFRPISEYPEIGLFPGFFQGFFRAFFGFFSGFFLIRTGVRFSGVFSQHHLNVIFFPGIRVPKS